MLVLEPKLAILDETDSGLDIDALKVVSTGVNSLRDPKRAVVLVTHYQRLLDYVVPDQVHVLSGGRIVKSGDKSLAQELERRGYDWVHGSPSRMSARACRSFRGAMACAHRRMRCSRIASNRRCSAFSKLGLPTTRDETWRYTNLRSLAAQSFVDCARAAPRRDRAERLAVVGGRRRSARRPWLMVNGYPSLLDAGDTRINGIEISSLRELSRTRSERRWRRFSSRCRMPISDAGCLLNTALFVDGLYLKITGK